MFDYRTFAPHLPSWLYNKKRRINTIIMEQKIKETEEETTMAEQTQGFGDINADSDIPGNTHLSNEAGENALEKLQAELDEQKDKYIRLFAEFDNYKRRSAKERIEQTNAGLESKRDRNQ